MQYCGVGSNIFNILYLLEDCSWANNWITTARGETSRDENKWHQLHWSVFLLTHLTVLTALAFSTLWTLFQGAGGGVAAGIGALLRGQDILELIIRSYCWDALLNICLLCSREESLSLGLMVYWHIEKNLMNDFHCGCLLASWSQITMFKLLKAMSSVTNIVYNHCSQFLLSTSLFLDFQELLWYKTIIESEVQTCKKVL